MSSYIFFESHIVKTEEKKLIERKNTIYRDIHILYIYIWFRYDISIYSHHYSIVSL